MNCNNNLACPVTGILRVDNGKEKQFVIITLKEIEQY